MHNDFGDKLTLQICLDYFRKDEHDHERNEYSFEKLGSYPLAKNSHWLKSDEKTRLGYSAFSEKEAIDIESSDPVRAVIFPGMDEAVDVPEITTECWDILGKKPKAIISNSSGVVFK